MKALFGWMVVALAFVLISSYTWMHIRREIKASGTQAVPLVEQARESQQLPSYDQDAERSVTFAGPLASYAKNQNDEEQEDNVERIEYHPTASDHVGGSVVGTSNTILKKTFAVAGTMQLPFDVAAHAYNPQLHGSFRSYLQGGRPESNASKADIEFLVVSDQDYRNLLSGKPSDAIFSADAAHDQEVNVNLPPTLDKPVAYHLVFRNDVHGAQKKLVQADFRIDY
jgi:hypothetical protein